MDKEIKVINENLMLIDFDFIRSGQIKRLQPDKIAVMESNICLTDYGTIIFDSKDSMSEDFAKYMKAIMPIPTRHLDSKEGFVLFLRNSYEKKFAKKQIIREIKSRDASWMAPLQTVYDSLVNFEKERRRLKKGV